VLPPLCRQRRAVRRGSRPRPALGGYLAGLRFVLPVLARIVLLGSPVLLHAADAAAGPAADTNVAASAPSADSAESGIDATEGDRSTRLVLTAEVAQPITPASVRFMIRAIDEAEERDAEILVFLLDTPGGLMDSMRDAVKRILASEVPVAVFVAPPGSRAASAGVFITLAAHVAAMAPGTNIGAAHPVNAGGPMDSTMSGKVTNDAVAYARSLAARRGRNADWAERAVRESVSLTSDGAVRERVVDLEVPTVDSLLAAIDGREVETIGGRQTLHTRGARTDAVVPTFRDRVLGVVSNPNIAYILMLVGIYGIIFELSNPGSVLPGILGFISLVLALYSFQSLPLNYAGVLLILFGIVLLVLEVKITSHGALTIGGIAALTIGSLMLVRSPSPFLRISLSVIIPGVATTAAFFLFVVSAGIRAQRRRRVTGREGLIGERAVARTPLAPRGEVFVQGELWSAVSSSPVAAGAQVVVESVDGLLLRVRPTEREG
jgi:membrane-bound serine protease (ClpP class)